MNVNENNNTELTTFIELLSGYTYKYYVAKSKKDIKMFCFCNQKEDVTNKISCIENDELFMIKPNNNTKCTTFNTLNQNLQRIYCIIINKLTGRPLFYVRRQIRYDTEQKTNLYPKLKSLQFDKNIKITQTPWGRHYVLFFFKTWMFFAVGTQQEGIYTFCKENNVVLYEHLYDKLDKLNKDFAHFIIIIDGRQKDIFVYPNLDRHLIYQEASELYTLRSVIDNVHEDFEKQMPLAISTFDDLVVYMKDINDCNTNAGKLCIKGITIELESPIKQTTLVWNTEMYDMLLTLFPYNLGINAIYLKLYQNDQLNGLLQLVSSWGTSGTTIIKRINASITNMSHEILDIYHKTRNQNNSELYGLLPRTYKKLLYILHNAYIQQKINKEV